MPFKTALTIEAEIVMLQELFISNQKLIHSIFNFYWLQRNRIVIRVMTVVRRNLLDKIVVEYRIDLINYPYFIFLEIRDLDQQSLLSKKTQILNVYNNQV